MEVKISVNPEANLLIEKTNIDLDKFLFWFTQVRKIWIGAPDVIDYLKQSGGKNVDFDNKKH